MIPNGRIPLGFLTEWMPIAFFDWIFGLGRREAHVPPV
jgi:hypothetical protein